MKKVITTMMLSTTLLLGSCASAGLTASSHITNVQLTNPNFRVVATNVSGEASSKAVLGVSYGLGVASVQLAIIPLTENRKLYQSAIKNFWSNFEASHGPVAGKRLALVNVRYDSESLNLLLFTKVTTVIVADVVEFD
jgi:hypothetical protein